MTFIFQIDFVSSTQGLLFLENLVLLLLKKINNKFRLIEKSCCTINFQSIAK